MHRTDKILEIKGPISRRVEIITENAVAGMEDGQILTIMTTDRAAKEKLFCLCEKLGIALVGCKEEGEMVYVQICK